MRPVLARRSHPPTAEADLLAQALWEEITGQPRILLAVLDPALRSACRGPLLRAHYTVSEAESALLVAELALSSGPDLLMLDLHGRDLSGRRLLRRLRGAPGTAELPVVGLVSAGPAGAKVEADRFTRLLPVPFGPGELVEAVGGALRRRCPIGGGLDGTGQLPA